MTTLLTTPPVLPRLSVIWVARVNEPLAEVSVTVYAPPETALYWTLPVTRAAPLSS